MTEKGKVVSMREGRALIALLPSDRCAQCRLCSLEDSGRRMSMEVDAVEGLCPGQEVTIQIDSRELLKGGWTFFILPLIVFIVGAAVAPDLTRILGIRLRADLASIVVGGLFLGLAFLGIFVRARSAKYQKKLTPRIVDFK